MYTYSHLNSMESLSREDSLPVSSDEGKRRVVSPARLSHVPCESLAGETKRRVLSPHPHTDLTRFQSTYMYFYLVRNEGAVCRGGFPMAFSLLDYRALLGDEHCGARLLPKLAWHCPMIVVFFFTRTAEPWTGKSIECLYDQLHV